MVCWLFGTVTKSSPLLTKNVQFVEWNAIEIIWKSDILTERLFTFLSVGSLQYLLKAIHKGIWNGHHIYVFQRITMRWNQFISKPFNWVLAKICIDFVGIYRWWIAWHGCLLCRVLISVLRGFIEPRCYGQSFSIISKEKDQVFLSGFYGA